VADSGGGFPGSQPGGGFPNEQPDGSYPGTGGGDPGAIPVAGQQPRQIMTVFEIRRLCGLPNREIIHHMAKFEKMGLAEKLGSSHQFI